MNSEEGQTSELTLEVSQLLALLTEFPGSGPYQSGWRTRSLPGCGSSE